MDLAGVRRPAPGFLLARSERTGIDELSEEERAIVGLVRDFTDREVRPVASELEHANTYPEKLIEQMKQLGIYGLAIPEPWCPPGSARPVRAGHRGTVPRLDQPGRRHGGHTVVAKLLLDYGTDAREERYLPRMASGEIRATMALTNPAAVPTCRPCGRPRAATAILISSTEPIRRLRRQVFRADRAALQARPGRPARPRGISILLVEHGPGFTVSRDLPKLGYKGVESCELSFDDFRAPADALLGAREGEGFGQMMRGLEIGRIQVASRAVSVGRAALEDSMRYAQQRESFGQPIWQHQSVGNYLADMATKLTAARQLVLYAARCIDAGGRADMEAGMAKLFASETAMEIALNAVRIHGGYGYSTEFDVERYFRDAPLMIVGEGTNEIQRTVIARQLIKRNSVAP